MNLSGLNSSNSSGLMGSIKLKTDFDRQNEKAIQKLGEIKENNDYLQKSSYHQMSQQQMKATKNQFQNQAEQLKEILVSMEKNARGAEQRGIVKKLKDGYAKEVDRKKRIMKSFVAQSFETRKSRLSVYRQSRQNDQQDQQKLFVDPTKIISEQSPQYEATLPLLISPSNQQKTESVKSYSINDDNQEMMMTEEEIREQEQMLFQEQQEELDEIEKEAIMLNKLVSQVGDVVQDQDSQIDLIQNNQFSAKQNLQQTNPELNTAQQRQKKSRMLYYLLALIVLLVVIILLILLIVRKLV